MLLNRGRGLYGARDVSQWSHLTNLTELTIEAVDDFKLQPGQLPSSLKKLGLSGDPIGYGWPIESGILPESLESFSLYNINGLLEPIAWPNSNNLTLVDLYITHFDDITRHSLPRSLRRLTLHINVHSPTPIDTLLTPLTALEEFTLHCQWEDPNDSLSLRSLSRSLTKLDLSDAEFNRPLLEGDLPASLRYLSLGGMSKDVDDIFFNQPLTAESFVSCPELEILDIENCTEYSHPIHVSILPTKLRLLRLPPGMTLSGEKPDNLRVS